ncbi:hypothetical protein RJD38_22180 (plasmid) [Vibrio scophthalmi]|uniref:hypothetical protein n=1 Tax=Vibrio scophthalmi TaxID=45658 RepID=UPI00349F0D1F
MKSLSVDAIPQELEKSFMHEASLLGSFWHDMFQLCLTFGLRNSEARELQASHIDLKSNTIILTDSKQLRSHVTKATNKMIDTSWLTEGRKFLRAAINNDLAPLLVRMCTDLNQLEALADEYDLLIEYKKARQQHRESNLKNYQSLALKNAPKARRVDFSRYPAIKKMLQVRCDKYENLGGFLFPACELKSNRASSFSPVTRQSVYRVIIVIKNKLETKANKFKELLEGIRLGLHSARKSAVQRIANALDIMSASLFIGHGNGSGDIATTQRYLDRSEKRLIEISRKLADIQTSTLSCSSVTA